MVDTFFSWLLDIVFPLLGDFFGKVSAIAMEPYQNGLAFLFNSVTFEPIEYVNLFTGTSDLLSISWSLPSILQAPLAVITDLLTHFFSPLNYNTPLVLALLFFAFINGIVITIIRFVFDIAL